MAVRWDPVAFPCVQSDCHLLQKHKANKEPLNTPKSTQSKRAVPHHLQQIKCACPPRYTPVMLFFSVLIPAAKSTCSVYCRWCFDTPSFPLKVRWQIKNPPGLYTWDKNENLHWTELWWAALKKRERQLNFGGGGPWSSWWSDQNRQHLKAKHKDTKTDGAVTHWGAKVSWCAHCQHCSFLLFFPAAMTEKLGLKKWSLIWWAETEGKVLVINHDIEEDPEEMTSPWSWEGHTEMSSDGSKYNPKYGSILWKCIVL